MEIISQHTKAIMEECKLRAKDAGLQFESETLEYIVTNRDMISLSPKVMIPTLYDYWVQDVEVLQGQGRYELYPSNPYETVINSRPAISFYNDNNPDWLNIMIFYHVLGHIDFFQNNTMFEETWGDDFVGQALADKRLIDQLRSEHGRWVDYVIEFSRGIDNLAGYYRKLTHRNYPVEYNLSERLDFYFDVFLQEREKIKQHEIFQEIERYNELHAENPDTAENLFFADVRLKYPEFSSKFEKFKEKRKENGYDDLIEFIRDNSTKLKQDENIWMKSVMDIVRNTALYFEPQIRTKIINEGWASYWHDTLFRMDDRIKGHEVAYAKTNAGVTSISRVGINPYAIGLRLIQYVEELADKGKLTFEYQKIENAEMRSEFDIKTKRGQNSIFELRKKFSDFTLINTFTDQDFVDQHKLFVAGRKFNPERRTWQYYVKSRKAQDYKQMLIDSLYHPPLITVDREKTDKDNLYLVHAFEGKQLVKDFIGDTMLGIEFLWDGQVQLETTEIVVQKRDSDDENVETTEQRVLYTMKDRKLNKEKIEP